MMAAAKQQISRNNVKGNSIFNNQQKKLVDEMTFANESNAIANQHQQM